MNSKKNYYKKLGAPKTGTWKTTEGTAETEKAIKETGGQGLNAGISAIKYPSKVKQVRLINNNENLHEDLLLELSTSARNFIPHLEKRKADQERSKY